MKMGINLPGVPGRFLLFLAAAGFGILLVGLEVAELVLILILLLTLGS